MKDVRIFSVEVAELGDNELFIVRTPNPHEKPYVTTSRKDVMTHICGS